jgi:hypothetical protein
MLSAALNKSKDAEETDHLRAKLRAAYERFMVRRSFGLDSPFFDPGTDRRADSS